MSARSYGTLAPGTEVASNEHHDSGYRKGGEHEPLHCVPEMRTLGELRDRKGLQTAGLRGLNEERADVAVEHRIGQRGAYRFGVDQAQLAVDRRDGLPPALFIAPNVADHDDLTRRGRGCRRRNPSS